MNSPQSPGGKVRAKQQREAALTSYYVSPNYCFYCAKLIEVPDGAKVNQVKAKKFCNLHCYKQYKFGRVIGRQPTPTVLKNCLRCGDEFMAYRDKQYKVKKRFCDSCRGIRLATNPIENLTKIALFKNRKNWQSTRSSIRRHAYNVFKRTGQPLICYICGYDKHVQIAHRKAVSDFANETLISEINNSENLVALCPNHHWEFDHKFFSLF